MTNWYISKDKIIKSNPHKNQILDKFPNSKIYDTYKESVQALSLLDNLNKKKELLK